MSSDHAPEPRNFAPKQPVQLDPPKSDPISLDYLSKCDGKDDRWSLAGGTTSTSLRWSLISSGNAHAYGSHIHTGTNPEYPTYVAIKGKVFDVTGNSAYAPRGSYHGTASLFTSSDAVFSSLP